MLSANGISVRLGDRLVLSDVSFTINLSDRWGLVGPNGAGKSTLLAILAGNLTADAGSVHTSPGTRVGLLQQGFVGRPEARLSEALDASSGGLLSAGTDLHAALAAFQRRDPSDATLAAYDTALSVYEERGGYAATDRLEAIMARLGLAGIPLDAPLQSLSGGEKTRAGLAALLSTEPSILLLDEPTNHLDIDALEWLERFVTSYKGGIVVVSHDRHFLDQTVTGILAIDPATVRLSQHAGTYSDYDEAQRAAAASHRQAYQRQQAAIARIERDIRAVGDHARSTEGNTQHDYIRARAKKVARTAKVRERKLERSLESADYLEKPAQEWGLAVEFQDAPESSRDVASLDGVTVAFDSVPVLAGVSLHIRYGERIALTGANRSGKSTLIRLLAGELAANSGTVRLGPSVVPGHYDQEQSNLELDRTVLDQVRRATATSETDARRFLHRFLFGGDTVHQLAGNLSYGELARLSLALLVLQGANFLLLDEPLNHLDLAAREQFEASLGTFNGTLLTVLHDRYAINRLATRVLELQGGTLTE
ncbi:MAG: ribosomal protection-like ABC-F family protein [Thermomicrobiales bacterium]